LQSALSGSASSGSKGQPSLNDLTDAEISRLYHDWRLWARDDQLPPADDAQAWRVWLLLGGRGAGKTRAGAEWVRAEALGLWRQDRCSPPRRIALIGETFADVRRVMIEGASGLLAVHPERERPLFQSSNGRLVWPNGSVAHVFSAESPDSLRGPQFEFAWCAAFAGAMLERSGMRATRSLRARSYLAWGSSIDLPRLGAIAVLTRGPDPALGHVGFLVGETDAGLVLLGGNQSNAVTVAVFERSRLLSLRWPDAASAVAQQSASDTNGAFYRALAHVLTMEGGFSDDPYDPGGPTNFGITLKTYATFVGATLDASSRGRLVAQLRAIPEDHVRTIYRQRYWQPAGCAALPAGLDLFHFDAAVNHGVGGALRLLQQALGVTADGVIGPNTRRAIDTADPSQVIERYTALRERRYRALPHFWRFGRGWLNRVAATRVAARARLTARPPSPSPTQPSSTFNNKGDEPMTDTASTPEPKWWGHSLTVWGAAVTAAAAILPALGPLIGLDITSEAVRQIGADVGAIVQAVAGVIGTLMTLYGRSRATAPLMRRDLSLRL